MGLINAERVSEDNSYKDFLEKTPESLAQQTAEWKEVLKEVINDEACYLIATEDGRAVGAMPSFIYSGKYGKIITSIPFAGPYGGAVGEERAQKVLIEEMIRIGKEEKCVLATIITPAFYTDSEVYIEAMTPDFKIENIYQYIDLQKGSEYNRSVKRNLAKAKEAGVEVCEGRGSEIGEWHALHTKRMLSLGKEPLPVEAFKGIKKHMKEKHAFLIAKAGGKIVGGGWFIFHQKVMDAYMLSTDPEEMGTSATYAIAHEGIELAKSKGIRYFNWQASAGNKGVEAFKAQWGSSLGKHLILTKILGDVKPILEAGLENVKKEYKWHYVIPYSAFPNRT
ncbi:GNAT family N-acetyltransferase [Candidatus Woesearchaeota archaeon]|nr:GNAT family N-acetyltransferase [Candidatus Woesearchaeota archaeon]